MDITKLTEEDWQLVKKHPTNIFDWRQKIRYNRIKQACRERVQNELTRLREQRADIERRERELLAALERSYL
jgi:hypothetical protein